MKIPFGKPLIGKAEKKAVERVLSGNILVHGPKALEFENIFAKFTKSPFAVSVSSCTAGMHLTYFTLGIGVGDEVIVPGQTHVATAHAVELTGAKAVFVDSNFEDGNIDINEIEKSISKKTKAIAIVHYLGIPVDMNKINKIAKKHNLFVIEDCALALGSTINNKHVGLFGDVGVFSFYPVKHMTTAEGGIIISKNKNLIKQLKLKKAFGVNKTFSERKIPGSYDCIALGFNYRMSELNAAIGIEQIKKVPFFLKKRKQNFDHLSFLLKSLKNIRVIESSKKILKNSHYCLAIVLDKKISKFRMQIVKKLNNLGIGTSIYYPQPVPRMKYYKDKYGYNKKRFKNAEMFSDSSICLPVGPHLNQNHMTFIAKNIISVIKNINYA
jgi:dTDP-4-amino-4,6-dideoxygalactose transaminase